MSNPNPAVGQVWHQHNFNKDFVIVTLNAAGRKAKPIRLEEVSPPRRQMILHRSTSDLLSPKYWSYVGMNNQSTTNAPIAAAPAAMRPDFAVGQIWMSRSRDYWRIVSIVPKSQYQSITVELVANSSLRQRRTSGSLSDWEFVPNYVGPDTAHDMPVNADSLPDPDIDKAPMDDFVPDRDKLKNYFLNKKKLGG